MDLVMGFVILAVLAVAGVYIYFLPTIVASKRRHRNRAAITVLNIALGWTLLGWVAALVWANTSDVEPDPANASGGQPSWASAPAPASGFIHNQALKQQSDERVCPFCAETIKAAAVVCKHCGRDLPRPESAEATDLDAEAQALGIVWSPVAERYMWRREFFKDQADAVRYAKANS